MDADMVTALLESSVRRLDENILGLRSEVKELRSELNDIKSKMQIGKGMVVGALFMIGAAAVGIKTMLFKLMGW